MTSIYHITHIDNLKSIVEADGLSCDRDSQKTSKVRIGHQHIKERRLKRAVPVGPGGRIGDYVPFYFAPRSPMLYAIHKGNVDGGVSNQAKIVHLVSNVESVVNEQCGWVFTDGHADMVHLTDFFDDVRHLDKIDWDLMRAVYWHDIPSDPDRKRRRQAEFLVHEFFPWDLVSKIGVYDVAMVAEVQEAIGSANSEPEIEVRRNWYY